MPFIAIAAAVILALGGGVSVAANSSLPGDALYPVKVNVNEGVESALSFSAESKAQAHIDDIQARISEAQQLAAKGKLDASAQADITANIDQHSEGVVEEVENLQAQGDYASAAQVAAKYQAAVAEGASGFTEAQANANASADARANVAQVVGKVQATLNAASNLSASASANAAAHGDAGASNSANTADNGSASSTNGTGSSDASGSTGTSGSVNINVNAGTGANVGL